MYSSKDLISRYCVNSNVESLLRQPDGAWSILNFTGLETIAKIRRLGLEIPMTEIYAGIDWAASAPEAAGADVKG